MNRNTGCAPAYPTVRYHMIRLEANHSIAIGISRSLLNDSRVAFTRQNRNRIVYVSLALAQVEHDIISTELNSAAKRLSWSFSRIGK